MTLQAVEMVIGKAAVDGAFRESLFADPDGALAGFDLSNEERSALRNVSAEDLETFAGTLDERISKSMAMGIYPEGGGGAGRARMVIPKHFAQGH